MGQHTASLRQGDPSDLNEKVAQLVTLKMVEMIPSAKADHHRHKHSNDSDSQWEDFEESSDTVGV